MQLTHEKYAFKEAILSETISSVSEQFRAIASLRQNLYLRKIIASVQPVDHEELQWLDAVDRFTWKQPRAQVPYWDFLGLSDSSSIYSTQAVAEALIKNTSQLLSFFEKMVQRAGPALEEIKKGKAPFPDTLLLRCFVDLLGNCRNAMNGLAVKHLKFNYEQILGFQKRNTQPDQVWLCARLSKPLTAWTLPAGIALDAGMDKNKKPIQFANDRAVSLNTATLQSVYTVTAIKGADKRVRVYTKLIQQPDQIVKDKKGREQSWKTFGGEIIPTDIPESLSMAIASPLLLLREGQRQITFHLNFNTTISPTVFTDAVFFLSTQKTWLPVTANLSSENNASSYTISVLLDAKQPAIESFIVPLDGFVSNWPLLKIQFNSFENFSEPPVLLSVQIEVTVSGLRTLSLYNDFGAVATKTPWPLFGPTPLVNNSFMVGSDEVCSKPVSQLQWSFHFDKLPADMALYYDCYNQYLLKEWPVQQPEEKDPGLLKKIATGIWNGLKFIGKTIGKLFHRSKDEEMPPPCPPLSNTTFTVDFQQLYQKKWQPFAMIKAASLADSDPSKPGWSEAAADATCGCDNMDENVKLFSTDTEKCELLPDSYFVYDATKENSTNFIADPFLQKRPLLLTDQTTSGFLRIRLVGPEPGFGSAVYPAVVADLALQNAWAMLNSQPVEDFFGFKEKAKRPLFYGPAMQPYVPKLASFTVNYSATQKIDFTSPSNDYPAEIFFQTPFQSYKIYDKENTIDADSAIIDLAGENSLSSINGIPLYPSLKQDAYLFMELKNLAPGNELNFLFALAPVYAQATDPAICNYRYLSSSGWKPMPVLSNSTRSFTCTGLLTVQAPADAANSSSIMPGNNWLAIGLQGNPLQAAETRMIGLNAFKATRLVLNEQTTLTHIPALTISKTVQPFPGLASLLQPFSSFDGKQPETEETMWLRASSRLHNKERALTKTDIYRLVEQEFDTVFYTRTIRKDRGIQVMIVPRIRNAKEANAFTPLAAVCLLEQVQDFLQKRISAYAELSVENFTHQYIQVRAELELKGGYTETAVESHLQEAIKCYFSPWIDDNAGAVSIDKPIYVSDVISWIRQQEGVQRVVKLQLFTWLYGADTTALLPQNAITLLNNKALLVPAPEASIEFKVN
jgi:hypothetical protein